MFYEPVIGLEIHAHLLTASKIFCGCSAAFGSSPNTHVCPVCLGLPGALPVLNRGAVDCAVRAALALGCTVHERSIFARKNYFYPDLPKGYQISQYEQPLATDGTIRAGSDHWGPRYDIRIKRVHMEEDAGKLLHEGFPDSDRRSYVDLNRAGVPLIEIVTEPDVRTAKDAAAFFSALRELLVAIGVNDGNMEEGSLRCDANVSVRPVGTDRLGTKVEIKNLNSFRFVEDAIDSEVERQIEALTSGERIVQETRLWDTAAKRTLPMRSKEEAHDYRYFPEPDLPPLVVDAARLASLRAMIPELPAARRQRLMTVHGLSEQDAVTLTQVTPGFDEYFGETVASGADSKAAKNWLFGSIRAKMNDGQYASVARLRERMPPARLAALIALVEKGTISGSIAKDVFEKMFASGRSAGEIVAAEGLTQIDDESQIVGLIAEVVAKNADAVEAYRAGKASTFGFLVGQIMKAASGKANPKRVNELLKRALDEAGDVIETRNLSKFYSRKVYALRDLTLTIDKGEFLFLTGPSGAGKSTFLRLLLREELANEGVLTVGGHDLRTMRPAEMQSYRRTVGFVFQDFRLIPRFTVFENVAFVMRVLGVMPVLQQRKTFQVLKWVGLQHRMNAFPGELSGGEQQRVAIARALVNDPQIVLADEPTGNLDPDLAFEIMNLFREVNARGTTVVVATHDRELIRRVGRRAVTLDHGRVVEVA